MSEPTRRQVMRAAAWSAPVIALAVAAPAAAASGCDPLAFIPSTSSAIHGVQPDANGFTILTKADGGNAIDCTVRINGKQVHHVNYVTQGKNPGDNQQLYVPGQSIYVAVGKNLKLSEGDFMQVIDCHLVC